MFWRFSLFEYNELIRKFKTINHWLFIPIALRVNSESLYDEGKFSEASRANYNHTYNYHYRIMKIEQNINIEGNVYETEKNNWLTMSIVLQWEILDVIKKNPPNSHYTNSISYHQDCDLDIHQSYTELIIFLSMELFNRWFFDNSFLRLVANTFLRAVCHVPATFPVKTTIFYTKQFNTKKNWYFTHKNVN